jgi:hypothetical protein
VIEDYFQHIASCIASADIVHSSSITYDKRSSYIGFIRGNISFLDGSRLHLREFVNIQHGVERYMYAYQYQSPTDDLVFRYGNTPHFRTLPTFPHHKHDGSESNVIAAMPPDLQAIFAEVRLYITEAGL